MTTVSVVPSQIPADPRATIAPISSVSRVMSWIPGLDAINVASVPRRQRAGGKAPKLLVCHDMMGGYKQDAHPQGEAFPSAYRIYDWQLVDTFVYFSHNLVTIPPSVWTNAAHRNGTSVLGTVITEWEAGRANCAEIFGTRDSWTKFADQLVEIAVYYGFDGWLVNIENDLSSSEVLYCREFMAMLTTKMHARLPGSTILWYDSVVLSGAVRYQNSLNDFNKLFFDACDGIFLNYAWNEILLHASASKAGGRKFDVYAGIDVFGRGTFGGGGFKCNVALKAIKDCSLSTALFAPGWVFENLPAQDFEANQTRFFAPFGEVFAARPLVLANAQFGTCFGRGYGDQVVMDGKTISSAPWSHIGTQDVALAIPFRQGQNPYYPDQDSFRSFGDVTVLPDNTTAWCGASSLRIAGVTRKNAVAVARLVARLSPVELTMTGPMCVSFVYKSTPNIRPALMLLIDVEAPSPQYVVLMAVKPDNVVPIHDDTTSGLAAKVFEKYHLQRSEPYKRVGDHLYYSPSVDCAPLDAVVGETGDQGWQAAKFVLCEHFLKDKKITEIRVMGQLTSAVQPEDSFQINIGAISIAPAKSVVDIPIEAANLRVSHIQWETSSGPPRIHAELDWSCDLQQCEHFEVFETISNTYLGRAYVNMFQVTALPCISRDGQGGVLEFVVQPVTHANLKPAIALCSRVSVAWSA